MQSAQELKVSNKCGVIKVNASLIAHDGDAFAILFTFSLRCDECAMFYELIRFLCKLLYAN